MLLFTTFFVLAFSFSNIYFTAMQAMQWQSNTMILQQLSYWICVKLHVHKKVFVINLKCILRLRNMAFILKYNAIKGQNSTVLSQWIFSGIVLTSNTVNHENPAANNKFNKINKLWIYFLKKRGIELQGKGSRAHALFDKRRRAQRITIASCQKICTLLKRAKKKKMFI